MNQPTNTEPVEDVVLADGETTEAEASEETKETAQQKFLNFVRIWQTAKSTAEVAERLGEGTNVASCQARASKYRANEYAEQKKVSKDGKPVFKCDIEGQPETTDAKEAVLYGGKGPKAGKPVPFLIRSKDKEGKEIIKRKGIPLKMMPKGGGRQLDVDAALALINELAGE